MAGSLAKEIFQQIPQVDISLSIAMLFNRRRAGGPAMKLLDKAAFCAGKNVEPGGIGVDT